MTELRRDISYNNDTDCLIKVLYSKVKRMNVAWRSGCKPVMWLCDC